MPETPRSAATFTPIAIVGRACLLPGAGSPAELAELVFARREAITSVGRDRWGLARERVMTSPSQPAADRAWSDRGGYVTASVESPSDLGVSKSDLDRLDPLVRWLCVVGQSALRDAGSKAAPARTGAIIGNLSFPTDHLASYAASVWLEGTPYAPARGEDPRDRFMSGLPAHLLATALGLGGPVHALDAACASSLYAIAQAADVLARGEAEGRETLIARGLAVIAEARAEDEVLGAEVQDEVRRVGLPTCGGVTRSVERGAHGGELVAHRRHEEEHHAAQQEVDEREQPGTRGLRRHARGRPRPRGTAQRAVPARRAARRITSPRRGPDRGLGVRGHIP